MANGPAEAVGMGAAGCGCLLALAVFVGGLVSGAGLLGSLGLAFVIILVAGYMASLVS